MKKKIVALLTAAVFALTLGIAYAETIASPATKKEVNPMCQQKPSMKLYMDTHDKKDGSFPASITSEQLNKFYVGYAKACAEEGVVIVRTYVSQTDGKAYCLNMATSISAIKRAHEKAGLPYNAISEVNGVAPTDLLLNEK
jgi:hypothetical protein